MRVFLEKNKGRDCPALPYFVNIEVGTPALHFETSFRIPIFRQTVDRKSIYYVEICGFQLKTHTVEEIVPLLSNLLLSLLNAARRPPTYVFVARRSGQTYPVYTMGDEVFATTPGGPIFRHVELAKVRDYLSDYLHTIGELGASGKSDKLHVRGINSRSLALIRPVFYLKKRAQHPGDNEFWAPVFPSDDGTRIYSYAASAKREVALDGGHEVFRLRSQVAQALMADHRLQEDYDLRADRLMPDHWQQVKLTLQEYPGRLSCNGSQFEMYHDGACIAAIEYRASEDRYSLFLGRDEEDLRQRAARDLMRRGLIDNPAAVQLAGESVKMGEWN